ncbi:sterol desaturase family protein [Halieaceae bacterium IMCC14734]|uniref:Sterol desaturase family protein n=1 Tax=Candidatus Litorirhabdus singularis TaxID=2518993 RepID=A0ABT3TD47_9GAMM|nr:sterol desaturase family protein [Candidatus Litorirhabdus singularis]MCX2980226.1 sterol desaturase family protein [Candidatus Litorirhabdus singularis]
MEPAQIIMLGIIAAGYLTAISAELIAGRIQHSQRPRRDMLFNLAAILTQPILTSVVVASAGAWLARSLFPTGADRLIELPFWPGFLAIFLLNEFCHYWVHRAAHEWRWMWKLHRTHHSGMDMNASLIYRYNLFWPMIVPQTWVGAIVMYFGLYQEFLAAAAITYLVNVGTHLSFRWDLQLRQRFPATEPAWRIIEKIITLPDTHQAHHAWGSKQAHPNGNYAVTLFFYDVLFGTAKWPRARQENFGLPISPRLHWAEELLWPIVRKPLLAKQILPEGGTPKPAAPNATAN